MAFCIILFGKNYSHIKHKAKGEFEPTQTKLHNSLKAMLHEAIFSATCNAMLTTTKHCKLLVDVRRLQLFSQLATQLIICLR